MTELVLELIVALALASSIGCFGGLPVMPNTQDLRMEPKVVAFIQHLDQEAKTGNSVVT